jgi:hypothetical protein
VIPEAFQPNAKNYFPGEFWTYRAQIRFKDCEHLHTPDRLRERKNIELEYGRNSSFVMSTNEGEFPNAGDDNNIFWSKHIDLMKLAMLGANKGKTLDGDVRAAGDIAGGGNDSVFMLRKGTRIIEIDDKYQGDELLQAEYWVSKLKALNIEPYQFCMDGQGMGATVEKYMRRLGYTGVNLFMANNSPIFKFQYKDRYTEIHWMIRDLLLPLQVIDIPQCDKLLRDMRTRCFTTSGVDDAIKTEDKMEHRQREKCSPDYLDTLTYLFTDFNPTSLDNMTPVESKKPDENAPTKMEQEAIDSDRGSDSFSILPAQESFEDLYRNGLTK